MCFFTITNIVDLCVAIGGIGTLGTFVWMICDSKNKAKQLDKVATIEQQQMNVIYMPDIRLIAFTGQLAGCSPFTPEIVVENNGQNLLLLDVKGSEGLPVLDIDSVKRWGVQNWDQGEYIHIPIIKPIEDIPEDFSIILRVKNLLDQVYSVTIQKKDNKVTVLQIEEES